MAQGSQNGKSNNPKGRGKGTKNKTTVVLNEWLEKDIMTSGEFKHPITILLEIANQEENDVKIRMTAADKVLPYIKARMSQIELSGKDGNPIQIEQVTRAARNKLEELVALDEDNEENE